MYLCLNRIRKETEEVIGETRKGSGVFSDGTFRGAGRAGALLSSRPEPPTPSPSGYPLYESATFNDSLLHLSALDSIL